MEAAQERALPWNAHVGGYAWRCGGRGPLRPPLTLPENGVPDDTPELHRLGLDPADFIPNVMLHFEDDFRDV